MASLPGRYDLPPREHHVDGETKEPCSERGVAAELTEPLPGSHEHILRGVVGLLRAEHPDGGAMNARDVPPIDAFEGTHVSSRGGGHIRRVVPHRLAFGATRAFERSRVRDRPPRSTHVSM